MPLTRLLSALAVVFWSLVSVPMLQAADVISPEETAKLSAARALVDRIDKERAGQAESFNGLLELRERLDGIRDDVRDVVSALNERLQAAQAQLAEFGAAPAAGAPPEPPQKAAERTEKQALVNEIDGHFRTARALQVQADQLWDTLNDMRRNLFNRRIFLLQDSFISPDFWQRVITVSLNDFYWRAKFKWWSIDQAIEARKGWPMLYLLAGFMVLLAAGLVAFHIWLARKQGAIRQSIAGLADKGAIVAHALILLAKFAAPFLITALAIVAAVTRLDIVPGEVQVFLLGVTGALVTFGIGCGASRAVFSPKDSHYRIVQCDDLTARRIVRALDLMLIAYFTGLITLGMIQMLLAHLTITVAATGLTAASVLMVGGLFLLRQGQCEDGASAVGLIRAPLHLLRPISWMLGAAVLGALVFGYIALASFIVGRALATALILCIAALVYVTIDSVFLDGLAPGRRGNTRVAVTLGISPKTVDLFATIIAGTLRVLTITFTVLMLLSPWGIEFGNVNPFEDVFFGVRFGDVRSWIGAAGIAIILFTVGLAGTRLFVGWLDGQLLPRTTLNDGVRHSITTIAGYLGFLIAASIALGQAGVQLQNIALVASALSVGIGFGLQQVVSNFVAGLIVLAERPIRVGDVIVVKGEEGKVSKISVRATELQLGEQSTVIVPNSDIVSSIVKNRSFLNPTHRATVKFILAHDMDLKDAFDILITAARNHPKVLQDPPPRVVIVRVAENGVELDLNLICERIGVMDQVRTDLYLEVMSAFTAKGIYLAGAARPIPEV